MKYASIALLTICVGLTGCATISLGPHQPSVDAVVLLRDSGISKVAVGAFSLGAGVSPATDKTLSARGNTLQPPNAGSFVLYLKEALIADLQAADKLDPASAVSIQAQLLENKLSAAGASTANATLAVHFQVMRAGQPLYEKQLVEHPVWKSSFVGAIALPDAINHYTEQYSNLLLQLYRDDDFIKACR